MVALVASFLVGVGVTLLVTRLAARRSSTEPTRAPAPVPPRIDEAITSFGEELERLRFDPAEPNATEAMVGDYRAALDAYDKAKAVPAGKNREARVAAALGKGHAALIRLDARIHHRPVPIEAIEDAPLQELRATGDRFLTESRSSGEVEVLIDRPEPGRFAIAEFTYRGDSNFFVRPMIRTQDGLETLQTIVNAQRTYRGRHLVPLEVTHFKIEARGEAPKWSVRILQASAALAFGGEVHGRTPSEVIAYNGRRTKVSLQVRTSGVWQLEFVPGDGTDRIHGLGDGMKELNVPRSGWLVVTVADGGRWSLQECV